MKFELRRQMLHLSGIVFVIFAQFVGREAAIVYFFLIAVFFFLYSWYIRREEKRLENFLGRFESKFRDFTMQFERKGANPFTGALFFYTGCTLAFVFFPFPVASAACAMLSVGDALSTLIGKKFGKRKIGNKTFEGSLACFLGSLIAGAFFVNPYLAVAGAVAAALAELVPRVDDNLTIPLASGLVMFLITLV